MQKQNRKETSILKFLRYIHSYAKNVRTITNLQNFHTYIQILQNSNLILDIIMLSRKEQGLFVYFFVCFLTFSTLCLSPTHKMENLKTFKKKKIREQLMTVNIFVSSIRSKCTCFAGVVTVFRKTEYRHTR